MTTRTALLAACAMVTLSGSGCESPEATRTRGGGPGADPQNRPEVVKMHEGSDPFWRTPEALELEDDEAWLDPARHARQQSVQP